MRSSRKLRKPPVSRASQMRSEGRVPEFPPLDDEIVYIADLWQRAGVAHFSGTGFVPLPATELTAWQYAIGIELTAWEYELIRTLSTEYTAQAAEALDPSCPAPYMSELQRHRDVVARKLEAAFSARAARSTSRVRRRGKM